jgi:hypothetical protein
VTIHWKEPDMSTASDHAGHAALSICEALLLAMNDHGVLPEHEILGVLNATRAAAHEITLSAATMRQKNTGLSRAR